MRVTIRGAVVQIGTQKIDRANWDWDATGDNPFWCPDRQAAQGWEGYLDDVRKRGSSCGAVIEVVASGVPVGLGDPVYDKLDADLAKALMSINAVKGVEIGDGFATAAMSGEENADEMRMQDGEAVFLSNHAGGILGGISTGQDIVCRLAVKPTSSILSTVRSVDSSATRSSCAPRAATIPASASAPRRWPRPWSPACWPIICCATAPKRRRAAEPVRPLRSPLQPPAQHQHGACWPPA